MGEGRLAFAANSQITLQFQVRSIYKDVKCPSPTSLKRILNRCGVSNVFQQRNRIGKRNVEALLRPFNDIRTGGEGRSGEGVASLALSLHLRRRRHTVTDAELTQDICHRRILHLPLLGLCGELLV